VLLSAIDSSSEEFDKLLREMLAMKPPSLTEISRRIRARLEAREKNQQIVTSKQLRG